MPVHHLGLTVSHIPSATSFYLQALQPLGYHFVGQHGDSIGLGVNGADLFLTQDPRGYDISSSRGDWNITDTNAARQSLQLTSRSLRKIAFLCEIATLPP